MSDLLLDQPTGDFAPTPVPAPAPRAPVYRNLQPGDVFPWLKQDVTSKAGFALDTLAGRYQLFGFFMSVQDEAGRQALDAVFARRKLFDDDHCSFTGVTVNRKDRDVLADRPPGVRFALDFDFSVSKLCGAAPIEAAPGAPLRRFWMLVDPSLHVLKIFSFAEDPELILDFIQALPPPDLFGGLRRPAPVLILPNVFEPELCRRLIALYDADGGTASGVHRDGKGVMQKSFKSRSDFTIEDRALKDELNRRIGRRVMPELEKLFFNKMTHIERYIVGCYSAKDGGHFAAHRDNGPGLTAHRRYAVSVNLNDDFSGGEVTFPEYSTRGYKVPAGWAVIFPCAILHQVKAVTAGARYAFLPFLYDDAGREIRTAELAKAGLGG